ncbi:GNAT family N-acetyltransferase [Paraburkholderia sp. UCT31]|nr:GNAT family N-acetyltransferase [Paraburkholderia sp. UCT31]
MISYQRSNRLVDGVVAYNMLRNLGGLYPDFEYWFINKCLPGIMVGTDELILARDREHVIGVALGKKSEGETKLRCVRVAPGRENSGVGIHLVEHMLKALDCDRPMCTVAEEHLHQFSRPFINHFGFSLTQVEKGMYRRGKLEYVFNATEGRQHAN